LVENVGTFSILISSSTTQWNEPIRKRIEEKKNKEWWKREKYVGVSLIGGKTVPG